MSISSLLSSAGGEATLLCACVLELHNGPRALKVYELESNTGVMFYGYGQPHATKVTPKAAPNS